jgi:sugar lactone lactonase YvrE
VLFTNFLTKPNLIFSGIVNGLQYWFLQHGEARGNQPLFYYMLMMPIYEPLALFAGLGTIIYLVVKWIKGEGDTATSEDTVDVVPATSDALVEDEYGNALPGIWAMRGLTVAFLAFWAIGAFIAFSIAGEKMPWLTMQIALPFTVLAAAGLDRLVSHMEWGEVRKGGGLFLGVAVLLFIFAAFSLVSFLNGSMPKPGGAGADLQNTVRGLLLIVFTLGLLALAGWLAYKMMPGRAVKLIGFTFALVLVGYGIRSMMLSSYSHSDVPTEMLVYTQSAPDTVIVSDLIKRLSRDETAFDADRNANDPTGGNGLSIALDQNDAIEWPFDWYFRDMKHLTYFCVVSTCANKTDVSTIAPNQAVLIASDATENEPSFQAFIKDKYTTNKYVLNWWFPEIGTYKNNDNVGDVGMALKWITSNGMKYILYRDPGLPLGSRNFFLHVRNDLAGKTGLGSAGTVGSTPPPGSEPTGPIHGMLDLAPQGAERGQFSLPRGIATAPDGSFYVVDTGNFRIQKFDSTGKFVSIIGSKGNGDGQFNPFSDTATGTGPGGIAVDKSGNVYVADTWNHRVEKFDSTGKFVSAWGSFVNLSDAAGAADSDRNNKFFGPRGIAIGPDGNVYVTDTGNKRVSIFSANGTFVREISSGVTPDKTAAQYPYNQLGEMNEPVGVAVAADGSVYVADSLNKRIQKFDAQGKAVSAWPITGTGWDAGPYLEPFLAVDSASNVYATEPTGAKVVEFSPTGQVIGEKQTSPNSVTLKNPTGVTIGSDGKVYVVDTGAPGVVNMGTLP